MITTIQKLRSKVFQIAHQLKAQFNSWSKALKLAWKIAKTYFGNATSISFKKKDGTERTATMIALGSLKAIKDGYVRFVEMVEGKTQWRSFTIEYVIF